jgi:hypothetical protein
MRNYVRRTEYVGVACIYSRKLKRGGFSPLRHACLSRMYVSCKGRKRREGEGQKEPDDNSDKLVRVMKTEPRV